jgi:hypothetical protein
MTLAEAISVAARVLFRPLLISGEVVLRYFGILSRRPRVSCDFDVVQFPSLPLQVSAHITLVRQRWMGDIDTIPECRVRLNWYRTDKPQDVSTVGGVWGDNTAPLAFTPARTLTENNPLNFIPLFMILSKPGQIRGKLDVDRVYVCDGVLLSQQAPTHMLRILDPGEYWFTVDLLRGRKPPVSFRWLLSISPGARFIQIEPALTMLEGLKYSKRTIRRPTDAPAEVIVSPLVPK